MRNYLIFFIKQILTPRALAREVQIFPRRMRGDAWSEAECGLRYPVTFARGDSLIFCQGLVF
jgi:hypothetical protein